MWSAKKQQIAEGNLLLPDQLDKFALITWPRHPLSSMPNTTVDQRRMAIACTANIVMFLTGMLGWYLAHSSALMADASDMLVLGVGVLIEVVHRFFSGSEPHGILIYAFAALSRLVNGGVLAMLSVYRNSDQIHLKATWVDTRADVIVNVGVLASGVLVAVSGYRQIDWIHRSLRDPRRVRNPRRSRKTGFGAVR